MRNIKEFIEEWQRNSEGIYSDHIDCFIEKKIFDYEDCLSIIKEVRKELIKQDLNHVKLMIQIQCGGSKKIQNWGEQFWKLIDANLTPPELYIGEKINIDSSLFCQQIYSTDQIENIENYIVFYSDEDEFTRCLNIVENEVSYAL